MLSLALPVRAPSARRVPLACILLVGLAGAVGCAGSNARVADLPPADVVIEKMVAAEGGVATFRTRHLRAEIHLVGPDLRGTFEQWNGGDGKLRERLVLDPFGTLDQGIDGDVVWVDDPVEGVRILEGAERAATVRAARLAPMAKLDEDYPTRRTVGLETIDGRTMVVLALTTSDGSIEEWCIDRDSDLRAVVRTTAETERGTTTTLYHESDYRRVDGVLIPFLARVVTGPESMVIRTVSVEHDVEIPAETFVAPESVRRHLEVRDR